MRETCYQQRTDGLLLFVKLTPNARKDEVLGVQQGGEGSILAAKVRAIPDKGKANKALIALISKWMEVPKSTIELKSGSKSRLKTLLIEGSGLELLGVLEQALASFKHRCP